MDGAQENGEALIEARGQVVEFGYSKIVSNIDVAVRAGEMVALIVPNGAEKSIIVRVMLGLLRPDLGEVTRRKILMIGTCGSAGPSIVVAALILFAVGLLVPGVRHTR